MMPCQLSTRKLFAVLALDSGRVRLFASRGYGRLEDVFAENNPFAVLGVRSTASAEEIKAAYRRAALRTHPDVLSGPSGSASETSADFRRVNQAYMALTQRNTVSGRQPASGQGTWGAQWSQHYSANRDESAATWRPRHSVVGPTQADKLFIKVFGLNVEEMMAREFERAGLGGAAAHHMHTNLMRTALYGKILKLAQVKALEKEQHRQQQQQKQQQHKVREQRPQPEQQPRWSETRERLQDENTGAWFIRVRRQTRWPDGRLSESVTDKPVYRV